MPDGLLLLAFAVTLVANAVLIVIAIRAMQPGGTFSDQPRRARREESARDRAEAPWFERGAPASAVGTPPGTDEAAATPTASLTSDTDHASATATSVGMDGRAADPAMDAQPKPRRGAKSSRSDGTPKPAARRARAAPTSDEAANRPRTRRAAPRTSNATGPSGNGRRRRFSLPPLDDDSEKVSRSIETFLSGGDPTADPRPPGDEPEPDVAPTTVALVAVTDAVPIAQDRNGDGPPPTSDRTSADADRPDAPATPDALAAVERSLRTAARGTDRVDVQEAGRFRVVLASAGELAARAYLRRVRATVEPLLEELDPPRRLAVATATVLGDPLDRADELAERRLVTAIEADDRDHGTRDDGRLGKPRASGD